MINHTKARHPPETKRKQVKWVIMLMDPCSKKRGKDDKSKSKDDGQVSLLSHAHYQSTWMALLLRDTLFELAKQMEKISTYLCYHTRERLCLERILHHECPSDLSIQEFALFSKVWKPSKLRDGRLASILGYKFWGSIDESDDVSHRESKVLKEI